MGFSGHDLRGMRCQDHSFYSRNDPDDVCYMIGLFFLPLGIVFSGLASAVDLRYLLSLACFLLWLFTIAGLSTLLAVLLPWKQLGESPKTDRFRCVAVHPVLSLVRLVLKIVPSFLLLYFVVSL